jgi:hypothetical protein
MIKYLKNLFKSTKQQCNIPVVSGSSVGFKKSPHHDKEKIIAILDDLEPDKMCKLVDFLNDFGY